MSQWVEEERPDNQTVDTLEKDIDTECTQEDRPEGLIGKNCALKQVRLNEGKSRQGREAIAGRHSACNVDLDTTITRKTDKEKMQL